MKKSKLISILLTVFYLGVIVFIVGFAFTSYQEKYEFYVPKKDVNMLSGSEYTIFLLANNEYNDRSYYTFSSSDENVVTVDNEGNLLAKSGGTAQITIKSKHGFHKNIVNVNVSGDNIYHLSFENNDINTFVGEEFKITPYVNGEVDYDIKLTWSSSDKTIVSVDNEGNTTSLKPGIAYITVKMEDSDFSNSIKITVSDIEEVEEENHESTPVEVETPEEETIINENISVSNITVSINRNTIYIGETEKLDYKIIPSDASIQKVIFTSNNEKVARVDENGNITAVGEGVCDIIVTTVDNNKTAYVTINVVSKKIDANSIKLNKKELSLYVGEKNTLTYLLDPKNATNEVSWSTSNDNVVSVNQNGYITAKSAGNARITVTTSNGLTDYCDVSVTNRIIEANSIKINKSSTTIIEGGSETLNVIFNPTNTTNKTLTWESSNSSVASVDQNGKVSAKSAGSATITAISSNNKTSSCTVNVSKKTINVTSIKLNNTSLTLEINDKRSLTYEITPSDATNQNVTWVSSNSAVVSVDNKGNITALKSGSAVITVKSVDGSKTSQCNVTVKEPLKVTGIEISIRNMTLNIGETYNLNYTIKPDGANSKVTWSSSDNSIISVDNGKIKALKEGSAKITVKTEEGYKDTCTVTALKPSNTDIKITKIAFDVSTKQMNLGDKLNINVSYSPNNATNRNLKWVSSNPNVAKVDSQGRVEAVGLGNATITATTKDGSKKTAKLALSVVVKGGFIDIRNKKYTSYYEKIATVQSGSNNIHMQNFVIENFGKSNETVYLSTVLSGFYSGNSIPEANKRKITRTIIYKLNRSTLSNKKRPTMYIENGGHGQAIDIDSNGDIWINTFSSAYKVGTKYWGGHSGLMRIKFKENNVGDSIDSMARFKITDSNDKAYKLPTPAIDEKNDLIAITTGDNIVVPKSTKILIYKYSDFKKGKLTLVYSFNRVSTLDTNIYRQGSALKDGYYYETRSGSTGSSSYLEVFNLLGELQYKVKLANGYTSVKREAEGIHIYNNNLYFGSSREKYLFDIGYYK